MSQPDPGAPYRHSTQPAGTFVNLQHSESQVYAAASRIFAGMVASNAVTAQNEAAQIEKSIDLALRMAQRVDTRVQSAEELDKK